MTVEICSASGYSDVGRNMTAMKTGDQTIIFDMGLHIENYVNYTEDEDFLKVEAAELTAREAAPDLSVISDWKDSVRAIIPSHAHLDHIGAIPFLAPELKAPIIATPFTAAVVESLLKGERVSLPNEIVQVQVNGKTSISGLKIELINMTHSTPETCAIAVHTPDGIVVYSGDFKLDQTPTLGKKSNLRRLEELGDEGVLALIVDSTNAQVIGKTPSEAVAREMLRDVVNSIRGKDMGIIFTTFSSHLARLKAVHEVAEQMNRKVLYLGRSMARYIEAAESCGIVNFTKDSQVFRFAGQIERALGRVQKDGKGKYLLVVSGHQAEPKSTLSKLVSGRYKYRLDPRDYVIFSCRVIPTETNRANRAHLEKMLSRQGVHMFKDIHQSGHGASEDIKEVISLLKPKHIIPSHGSMTMRAAAIELAKQMGYKSDQLHLLSEGDRITLA